MLSWCQYVTEFVDVGIKFCNLQMTIPRIAIQETSLNTRFFPPRYDTATPVKLLVSVSDCGKETRKWHYKQLQKWVSFFHNYISARRNTSIHISLVLRILDLWLFSKWSALICTNYSLNELHFRHNEQLTFVRFFFAKEKIIYSQHLGRWGKPDIPTHMHPSPSLPAGASL
jgi:hypothetical protein